MGETSFDKTDSSFISSLFALSPLKLNKCSTLCWTTILLVPFFSGSQTHSGIPREGICIMNPLTLRMRLTLRIKQFLIWGYILAIGKKRKEEKRKKVQQNHHWTRRMTNTETQYWQYLLIGRRGAIGYIYQYELWREKWVHFTCVSNNVLWVLFSMYVPK